ncbi:hypothetical protein SAMN05216404_10611 [Nitrosospira multiformis]|uniref:Uncharacterized protein n=1 Tax=Nitrosospira multiformis TaxID=1231 RepID=A0A1H8I9M0_9PROT|nr:hypothetical protein SAMN05216404_10611 [Nitrosospira multiformis]
MNIPGFTADLSLYRSTLNYSLRGNTTSSGNGIYIQQIGNISLPPTECQLICERFFENGVSFERCRVECPMDDGGGGGDSLDCRERCREMGLSQTECMRLCLGLP